LLRGIEVCELLQQQPEVPRAPAAVRSIDDADEVLAVVDVPVSISPAATEETLSRRSGGDGHTPIIAGGISELATVRFVPVDAVVKGTRTISSSARCFISGKSACRVDI
jgi:hypothetical protein